jgi:hypothetical protein
MRLDRDEMALFEAACADPGNLPAQELLNVFAVATAPEVLAALPSVPLGMFTELAGHIWNAVEEAKRRERFGARFVIRAAAVPC